MKFYKKMSWLKSLVPTIKLSNGGHIPMLGLGTWKSKSSEVKNVIETAIELGYRHFDCALVYGNEAEIGDGISCKILKNVVSRSDLFLTGKLWNTFHRPDLVEDGIKRTLYMLKTDHLDLYLMHWPMGFKEGSALTPKHGNKILYSLVHYVETWHAMEKLVEQGLTKSIGVSNFNKRQLETLIREASIKPTVNQIECHPYLNQEDLISFCKNEKIAITCYSPLGSPDRPGSKAGELILLKDPILKAIGAFHKKSPAQIALRYQIERGNIVIPKSAKPWRLEENMNIFNFQLSSEDMEAIDSLDCGKRYITFTSTSNHPFYPFSEKESRSAFGKTN